jgi:type I restriction enzyme S subunit
LNAGNVTKTGFQFSDCQFISANKDKQLHSGKLSRGDVVLTTRGTVGNFAFYNDDIFFDHIRINSGMVILRKTSQTVVNGYLYVALRSRIVESQIERLSFGSAQPQLTVKGISTLRIPIPPTKNEQTAIAAVLSDLDTLIASLDKLIAKKREIKQATMQQLLTGKTRLPGFNEEWEMKRLGDIAEVGRGRVISHREINASIEGKYPVYSSQTSSDGIMGYIDTFDFDGEYVTWTTDGVNAGTVFYRNGKFNCTNVCGTIKLKKDNPQFVAILLNKITPNYVSRNLANPKLMNDILKKIKIPLPPFDEQTSIAAILSDMDAEIVALEQRRDKTRVLKQGMMQELLTGKTRLI